MSLTKTMHTKQLAVFGSAFNPPHMGHADVVNQALEVFDQVIMVPSFVHAFGKQMAPFALRVNLTQMLVEYCKWGERVSISSIEQDIAAQKPKGAPVYTFDVLNKLQAAHPQQGLVFVVGPDNAQTSTWQKFYKADQIEARWGLWAAQERQPIRSTMIRTSINQGLKIGPNICPEEVVKAYANYLGSPVKY